MLVSFFSTYAQLKLDANGNVAIGTISSLARLNIQPTLSTPGSTNLLIGNWNTTGQGCISIGVHQNYSWMQTWNNLPLYINSQGNNVIFFNDVPWGNIGIGVTSPSSRLQVSGNIVASGTVTWSDNKLKKNMNKIVLDETFTNKINQLAPISYEWNKEEVYKDTESLDKIGIIDKDFFERIQYGFSAQEVQKLFPELVYEDNNGTLGINYQGFIPMLFSLIQKQELKISALENEIVTIKNDCCSKTQLKSANILNPDDNSTSTENVLYQNTPNPFTVTTSIRFSISKEVNRAMLNVYNMNGAQLKSIELSKRGAGSIVINGGEFNAGMYFYALITDGQVIDTKRMVLTE